MTLKLAAALVLASVAAGSAFAQVAAGSAPPSTAGVAASGTFKAGELLTSDRDGFVRAWSVPGTSVQLATTSHATRGPKVATFLVFSGCTAAPSGNCDVKAEFRIVDPAGKVTVMDRDAVVWNRPPTPPSTFALSQTSVDIGFDASDAPGDYKVQATVTDNVAKASVEVERDLRLDADAK